MFYHVILNIVGFPGGSVVKNLLPKPEDAGHVDSLPQSGRSLGEGNSSTLQYSCLENSMDFFPQRRLMGYSPWDHKNSDTTEQLSTTLNIVPHGI